MATTKSSDHQKVKIIIPFILIGLITLVFSFYLYLQHYANTLPNKTCEKYTKQDEKFTCYQEYFKQITLKKDPRVAIITLIELESLDPFAAQSCHEILHIIGDTAYERYKDVNIALPYGNDMCFNGYYHGILESYMGAFDDQHLAEELPNICKLGPDGRISQNYFDCVHGLGHGLTIRFEDDVFRALPYCGLLKTAFDRNSCYNGAFMQNIVVDGVSHHSTNLKPEDPLYPCNSVAEDQKDACYLIQTSYVMMVVNDDVNKAFKICDSAETNYVKTCYQSMGRDIASLTAGDASKIVEMCANGNPVNSGECFAGAAIDLISKNHNPSDADYLCQITPSEFKSFCESGKKSASLLQMKP